MSQANLKAIGLPVLTKKSDSAVRKWWIQMKVYARVGQFHDYVKPTKHPALPVSAEDETKLSATEKAAVDIHDRAIAFLTMALSEDWVSGLITRTHCKEWPTGQAHEIIAGFLDYYYPDDQISKAELYHQLGLIKMKKKDDPAELFSKIAYCLSRTPNANVSEEHLLSVITTALPKKYMTVIHEQQNKHGDKLTRPILLKELRGYYRLLYSGKSTWKLGGDEQDSDDDDSDSEDDELAMSTFTGKCFKCKKKGHRASECKMKSPNSGGRNGNGGGKQKFQGTCNNCGAPGHKAVDCWELEKNASKRPTNWKSRRGAGGGNGKSVEQSHAAIELMFVTVEVEEVNVALSTLSLTTSQALTRKDLILADTCATSHNMSTVAGAVKVEKKHRSTMVVSKSKVVTDEVADMPVNFLDANGKSQGCSLMLKGATVMPGGMSLLATGVMTKMGWTYTGDNNGIVLVSPDGKKKLVFDVKIETEKGVVFAARWKPGEPEMAAMSVQTLHAQLGHCGEDATRKTAKQLGIDLTKGSMGVCESCAIGKAKQKNVPKSTKLDVQDADTRRVYLDIASLKNKKGQTVIRRRHWHMMVNAGIGLKFTQFLKKKSDMIEPTCVKLKNWEQNNLGADVLRMDNAKENKKLAEVLASGKWQLPIEVEFTARKTPQQNSLVETGFASIANRARAMMIAANVPANMRRKLFPSAAETATDLDGLIVVEWKGKTATRYEHWIGKNPKFAKYLRTWGEAGTVTVKTTRTSKVDDRGITCMMVGYAKKHDGDVYMMWNPKTNGVYESRDVTWLNRMYYAEKDKNDKTATRVKTGNAEDTIEFEEKNSRAEEGGDAAGAIGGPAPLAGIQRAAVARTAARTVAPPALATEQGRAHVRSVLNTIAARATRSGRIVKPTEKAVQWRDELAAKDKAGGGEASVEEAKLEDAMADESVPTESELEAGSEADPDMQELALMTALMQPDEVELCGAEEIFYDSLMDIDPEFSCVGAGIGGGFTDTSELHVMKYDEAMHMADEKEVQEWHDAVAEEKERMDSHGVFEAVPLEKVPSGAKILSSTWAMKKKANGKKRARLNARGFEQVDGEHYNEDDKAAPVVTLSTIMIMLTLIVMLNWTAVLCDVNGAFLLGDFEADLNMYMYVPQGFEKYFPKEVVLKLLRPIYGCRQSAKRFWVKLLSVFNLMKFKRGAADPCIYFRWIENRLVLIASWVDDLLICGRSEDVMQVKKELFSHLKCDDVGELTEYVGCKILRNNDSIQLTQPVLLQSFRDEFELPAGRENVTTPAPTGQVLVKGEIEDAATHSMYRSGVGKLMHLMRWSRPEILNSVRELSRFFSGASLAHVAAMYRVMNYCLNTSTRGRVLKPDRKGDESKLKEFKFRIKGRSDSNFATDPERRKSVTGYTVFLEGAPTATKSKMQECVTVSVTEAEYVSAADCAQEMLFQKHVLESVGLKVELPMILEIANKGAIDLANNWGSSGRTKHVDVRHHFLRDLKEEGIIKYVWISTKENSSDLFTKNLDGPTFAKHALVYCSDSPFKEEGVAGKRSGLEVGVTEESTGNANMPIGNVERSTMEPMEPMSVQPEKS